MASDEPPGPFTRSGPPDRLVSANDIVSLNMAAYRKAAGLSQQDLADRLGWMKSVVSTAERTWGARRTRNFTADDLTDLARVLGLPVTAFLLPPEDDGTAFRYVVDARTSAPLPLRDLLPVIYGPPDGGSPAAAAYRRRLIALGWSDERAPRETDEVREARRQAGLITGDARARAESLERDAQERHRQAMMELVTEREELERRVDDLRYLEREYRSRVERFAEGLYRGLWAGVEGVDPETMVEALRDRAEQLGPAGVTAILLGDDGTYAVATPEELGFPAKPEDGGEHEPGKGAGG